MKRRSLAKPRGIRVQELPIAHTSFHKIPGWVKVETGTSQAVQEYKSSVLLDFKAVCDHTHLCFYTYVHTVSVSWDAI